MPLTPERLREIVFELAGRPGHEKVRSLIYELLVNGLGASSSEIFFEKPLPEVHGRLDALLGRTVFEFKSNLRTEMKDAEEGLTRYLQQREKETGEHFIGIATDGVLFVPFELRDGKLQRLAPYETSVEDPRSLLNWLSAAVVVQVDLPPEPETVQRELGKQSLAYHIARSRLAKMWLLVADVPEVKVKRQLWADFLQRVYGSSVDDDSLFFQHTYLTIVAKTMAIRVLGISMPSPQELLSGEPFHEAGVNGAVESDFFDWVLEAKGGANLVLRIAEQVKRFRLREVQSDVLKGLYESLIDPEQRHELGEYYTPDWLAFRMCSHVIQNPLEQRVLDPACGSGTFLFHSVRRFLSAASEAKLSDTQAVARCCELVLGIDVHPVAVIIARVNYLLALGQERLQAKGGVISIPVYLGDSLQWNTERFLVDRDILIEVPEGPTLHFPGAVARDPATFDAIVQMMLYLSEPDRYASPDAFAAWLKQEHAEINGLHSPTLVQTYSDLLELRKAERDHIWGFVARNLSRPIWLSSEEQRADVVIGNPPWLSYRFMSSEMQQRFREECQRLGIWAGGKVATHQDLSAYFFVRSIELYLKPTGTIAFVMPFAALSRQQFEGFRKGWYGRRRHREAEGTPTIIRFWEAWAFDDRVQPLFPVPSAVLFASPVRENEDPSWPNIALSCEGRLPRRDASPSEASASLKCSEVPLSAVTSDSGPSPYRDVFHQGATVVPRMLFVVERAHDSQLGPHPTAPKVRSRRTSQEKRPWKLLPSLEGNIEADFLRPLYLGESVAPFRLLSPVLAVIPCDEKSRILLDSQTAQTSGHPLLADWLSKAERLWQQHSRGSISLLERIDYYGNLLRQIPIPKIRAVYAASGAIPASAILDDQNAVIEHGLYWVPATSRDEAHYLVAVLNSETTRARIADLQARGQWGARHFDKLLANVIPAFDASTIIQKGLIEAAKHAEEVAAGVSISEGIHFIRARRLIRDALRDDGVAQKIDNLVAELLDGTLE